jgi:uncharacterized OB-fold protein/acyl dehydratase
MLAGEVAEATAALIRAEAERIKALGESSPRVARDPVNLPIIENWVEAIGDTNPVYTDPEYAATSVHGGLVAPPAMTQVWTMAGQRHTADVSDPTGQMVAVLEDAGYTSVVATNSDHVFRRYVRLGERLSLRVSLTNLIGPKQTTLGEGWFFTTRNTWYRGDEAVATMDFRILKFRPSPGGDGRAAGAGPQVKVPPPATIPSAASPDTGPVIRPVVSPDTRFFWDGMSVGELRIQRCTDCGTLRHPPGPMCPACGGFRGVAPPGQQRGGFRRVVHPGQQRGSADPGYVLAAGTGTVFSYVVHHHPPVPGKRLPLVIALVELDEGVRVLGEMTGVSPDQVRIGMPVQIEFLRIDDELTLPAWRPGNVALGHAARADDLPELVVEVTPTFVVASALATRDFTPVHHDVGLAVANGSKDIFLNILTDTGLVQRFITQWAGPQSIVREISIRLGVPCYAGDTLTFTGHVAERTPGGYGDRCLVKVTGRCSLGDHIIATALLDVPGSPA